MFFKIQLIMVLLFTEQWVKINGNEKKLPGLTFSARQLFWLSQARISCTKYGTWYPPPNWTHPVNYIRVNGAVRNSLEFSRDFNCNQDAKMNPREKCKVW